MDEEGKRNNELIKYALDEAEYNGKKLALTDIQWKGTCRNFVSTNKVNPSYAKYA